MDFENAIFDGESAVHGISHDEDVIPSGSIFVAIEHLRRDMNQRLDNLKREIAQISRAQTRSQADNTELSAELRAGLSTIKSLAEELAGAREVKGRRLPRQTLFLLPYAAGFDRAVKPLLAWSPAMWTRLVPHAEVLDNSKGIAMLLFAAKNNSKAKMGTSAGRLWTFLLRRALRTVIVTAKTELFQKPPSATRGDHSGLRTEVVCVEESSAASGRRSKTTELPPEPEWLAEFKESASIVRAVEMSMQKFEGYLKDVSISSATVDTVSEGPRSRPKKRKKSSTRNMDPGNEDRLYVVKEVRSMWLDKMNNGRTAARAYLYRSMVFILDKIAQFKDVDRAGQKGYRIDLHKEVSSEEDISSGIQNVENTIWNIPDACVTGSPDTDAKNRRLLEDLKAKFPSLRATIQYKKEIERDTNDADPSFETARRAEYVTVAQDVYFHDVAVEMLMEIHSCDRSGVILATSQLSLKAVHVLAIALRALVIDVLDQWRRPPVGLSTMEMAAFGTEVTLDDEKKVAVMTERRLKNGNISDTYNACYREKFFVTEAEAEVLRRDDNNVQRRTMVSPAQENPTLLSDGGDDDTADWLHKK